MVEFAVLAPVFIFLLIGLIEIGRFTFFALLAANAARAGAQYGAQTTFTAVDTPGITTAVLTDGQAVPGQNLANWTTAPGSITANCYYTTSTGGPPSGWQLCSTISAPPPTGTTYTYYVQVNVTGTFTSLLKYPGIPQQVPVSGSATMRVASQ
ncbi:MAG: TadE family protein [Candidatus Tumulicola sp.]